MLIQFNFDGELLIVINYQKSKLSIVSQFYYSLLFSKKLYEIYLYNFSSIFTIIDVDGLKVKIAPIEATTIALSANHWVNVNISPKKNNPHNAPITGSILINVPNVFEGKRVNAAISNE